MPPSLLLVLAVLELRAKSWLLVLLLAEADADAEEERRCNSPGGSSADTTSSTTARPAKEQ
jgi:hypothetical protein